MRVLDSFNRTKYSQAGPSCKEIAESAMDIATNMKSEENDIIVSSIKARGDGFNGKAGAVNEHLMKFCLENDTVYLDNRNICLENLEKGGTWGGLHSGTELFEKNILDIRSMIYERKPMRRHYARIVVRLLLS